MTARVSSRALVLSAALASLHCDRNEPRGSGTPQGVRSSRAASSAAAPGASNVAASSSVRPESSAPVTELVDCEQQHWPEPWHPRQLTASPRQTVACGSPDCVSIEPVLDRGDGCTSRPELRKCRRATLTPRVASGDPARARSLQALLDSATADDRADDCWLTFLDYTIHHDAHGILDLSFRASGAGAYPDTQAHHLKILLASGEPLRAVAAFSRAKHAELFAAMKRRVSAAWNAAKRAHPEVFRGREEPAYGTEHLENFIVHAEGVTFLFDFGLPHAVDIATPASEFEWTKAEIRRFIDPEGPLRFLLD